MSHVEKRKAMLVAYCLNNLYGCYASLETFLNVLIMKKKQHKIKNNSQDHLIKYLKIFQKER